MTKFDKKSALYEKLRFFKKINLALVLCGALWRKLVKNWILEPYLVNIEEYWSILKFWAWSCRLPNGVLVSTLNSHPEDWGSNPIVSIIFFSFFLLILQKNQVLFIKKSKTQLKNCSFNFIFFTIFSMHLLHMMIKWSQKF